MSMLIYGILGMGCGLGMLGWYLWFDYFTKTRDIAAPFLKVARSKGKKILLLIDTGAGAYKLVDAEREALGYTTKEFGNFEAYEEGIKPFGSGVKKVPMGLAHAELEVNISPGAAIWIQKHGGQLTQQNIDAMPDVVEYLYCDKPLTELVKDAKTGEMVEVDKGICGWIGPLMPQEGGRPSAVKDIWRKIVDASKSDNNILLPKPDVIPEDPTCPQCKSELKKVVTDRTYSTIPNQVIYTLSSVRKWIEEVVSPLNMEMAIESTKLNTMKKAKNNMDEMMKYAMFFGPFVLMAGLAYVMISSQGGGGDGPGMMENMGTTLKSGAGQ